MRSGPPIRDMARIWRDCVGGVDWYRELTYHVRKLEYWVRLEISVSMPVSVIFTNLH